MSEMTWEEVKNCLEKNCLVIIPVGSFEEHGPHLPLITDSLIVEEIVKMAAQRLVNEGIPVLVTPTIVFGYCSKDVRKYPGTIALRIETFINLIEDIVLCLIQQGFKRFLIVNSHGQNYEALRVVVRRVYEKTSIPIALIPLCVTLAKDVIEKFRKSEKGGIMHAGELETSIILYLNEELVKLNKLIREVSKPPSEILGGDIIAERKVFLTTWSYWKTEKGVLGDATKADKKFGETVVNKIVNEIVEIAKELYLKVFPKIGL